MSFLRGRMILGALLTLGLAQPARADPPQKDSKSNHEKSRFARTDLYGDPLPDGAVARMGTFRLGHGQMISTLAFAADGKMIVSASDNKTVRVWGIPSGKEIRRFTGPGGHAWSLAFSGNAKLIAWSTSEAGVELWDWASAKRVCGLPVNGESISRLSFSQDGKTLATAGREDKSIRLWDVSTGKELGRFETPPGKIEEIVFSPGGKLLAYTKESPVVRLLNVGSRKEVAKFSHTDSVSFVGFASDDSHLVTASRKEGTIWELVPAAGSFKPLRSWAVGKGERLGDLIPRSDPALFSVSPDSKLLVTASGDGTVRFWEVASGKEIATVAVGSLLGQVEALAFAPDSKTLATASWGKIRFWDVATGKRLDQAVGHQETVRNVAFALHGRRLATLGQDVTLRIWESTTGKEVHCLRDGECIGWDLAASPDGNLLATTTRQIGLWDPASGKLLRRLKDPERGVGAIAFSRDGKSLLVGGEDQIMTLEMATGKRIRRIDLHREDSFGPRRAEALSPDGRWLVQSSLVLDGPMRVWPLGLRDVATGKELRRLKPVEDSGVLNCFAFSPDSRLLAVGAGWSIHLREVDTGKERGRLSLSSMSVNALAFSPTGKSLASAGWDDTIRVWELATGTVRREWKGHATAVHDLAFSPDARLLASGNYDGTALV